MNIKGVRDDRMVLSAFVQQLEERKAQIQATMENVHTKIKETKAEEAKFEKVIKEADPKQLSLGSAQKELQLRQTIIDQKREIEELQRKLQNLEVDNSNHY